MIADAGLRRWHADVVGELVSVPGVEPVLLIVDDRASGRGPAALRRAMSAVTRPHRIWDAYNNRWVARRSRALQRVELPDALRSLPSLRCRVEKRGRWSEHFSAADLAAIRAHDPDVLVRFAFGIIRGDILSVARFGVWSFHHDDEEVVRGGPPAFWEVAEGHRVTGAVLQRLTDRLDGGQVLHKGWFRTSLGSYVRNTDAVHLGGADWPARQCRAILAGELAAGEGRASTTTAPVRHKPTDRQTARFLVRQTGAFLRGQARAVATADQWDIGLVRRPIRDLLDREAVVDVSWLGLATDRHTYAADPFVVDTTRGRRVLYERFDQRRRAGAIWWASLDDPHDARPAGLPVEGHASYPFVFADDDRTWCVPQVAGRPARLFELRGDEWIPGPPVGPERPVLDSTIVRHDGRWWMFATPPGPWSLTKLEVFWADTVDGPWHAHLLNPVKTDVRSARPGGTPFIDGGRLYRPAQDCSTGYGSAVALCEVDLLTPTAYDEHVVRFLAPSADWDRSAGLHTLSDAGDWTLVDAKRVTRHGRETLTEAMARLRRLRAT